MKWFNGLRISTKLGIGFALMAYLARCSGRYRLRGDAEHSAPGTHHRQRGTSGPQHLRTFQAMKESMYTYTQSVMLMPDINDPEVRGVHRRTRSEQQGRYRSA